MAGHQELLEQYDALKESKSKLSDGAGIPKISKTLPVHNWIQSTTNYANCILGARTAGLEYVLRDDTAVAILAPVCAVDEPYSEEYGSLDGDYFNRLSHTHTLIKIDNGSYSI